MNCSQQAKRSMVRRSLVLGTCCAVLCLAVLASAQYNNYESDSNSDSEGGPILTNSELGKLVRNSGHGGKSGAQLRHLHNQQLAATRNLYSKQQPLQYAPTQHNRRQYGGGDQSSLANYNPLSGAASTGRGHHNQASADDEDGESGPMGGSNFGGSNFDSDSNDEGSSSSNDGGHGNNGPMNLNQAASGYPGQGDYSGEQAVGFGFGGPSSADGADFGSDAFGGEGSRAKSASSLMGAGLQGDEDSGAPQYGPNSAINAGEADDEGRAGYAPESASSDSGDDDD